LAASVTISSATVTNGKLEVVGSVSGTPGQSYEVKVYATRMVGRTTESVLLGTQTVAVGASGVASLSFSVDARGLPVFDSITATASAISGRSPVAVVFGS
jgi:hypothetical protein